MTAVDGALLDRVRVRLAEQGGALTPSRVAEVIRAEGGLVGDAGILEVVDTLRRDIVGAGRLDELIGLDGVTDILVNGPRAVYVDKGAGLQRTSVEFPDDAAVRRLGQRLASSAGRRLDDASPYVDVRLRDGTRFHAVLAPVSRPGTCLSLRVPARRAMTLDDLVKARTVTEQGARLLLDIVRANVAFLVSGGTGSGKTTLLAALLSYVSEHQRIVLVEDSAELRPSHDHVVSLEGRQPNVEGVGEITVRELVRQALRMRPDRLVVGEVRGGEVVDLLAALNTGHEGGCGTIHANSSRDVPARIEALAVAAGLARDAVHSQLAAAVQVVIHLRRDSDGTRRVDEIATLTGTKAAWSRRSRPSASRATDRRLSEGRVRYWRLFSSEMVRDPLARRVRPCRGRGCHHVGIRGNGFPTARGRSAGRRREAAYPAGRAGVGGRLRLCGLGTARTPLVGVVLLAGLALLGMVARNLTFAWLARQRRRERQLAVIELCDALSAELRGGLPAISALERAGEARQEWVGVVAAARLGNDVVAALRGAAEEPGAEGLRAVAAGWEVAGDAGAALADVLERIAAGLRSDDDARAEVTACLGPVRATAKMLAVLPVFGLALGSSMGAQPMAFLVSSGPGLACLGLGVTLACVGVFWVERLATAAEA